MEHTLLFEGSPFLEKHCQDPDRLGESEATFAIVVLEADRPTSAYAG